MAFPAVALMLTLALTPSLVQAAKPRQFIDEAEPAASASISDGKAWEEGKIELPPWPKDSDLVEFQLDTASPSRFRYFIDGQHISIGRDDVVRYTLVAESPTGTRNITFEGLRCKAQGVFRTYAYGSDHSFKPLEGSDWQTIITKSGDQLHRELYGHFLCGQRTFEPRPIPDMIRALQGKIHGRENAGFQPD
ncbi:MAG: CNP1-like family protein [Chromatiaceae bacterium]